jgi:CubicO group peptidase (beta-lactamase class C family)
LIHQAAWLWKRFARLQKATQRCVFALTFCGAWGVAAAQPLPPDELPAALKARIDAFVETERAASRIPGLAVAIVQNGRVAHIRGYGIDGDGHPITAATLFPVGSLTKSFTAVLVRQLVEAGRIDPDAPVQRYLPWFKNAEDTLSSRITVRHLLNQTSGFSRQDGMQLIVSAGDADIKTLARRSLALTLTAEPGQRYQYSNLNFVLLGALVETIEQRPWSELVQQRVFAPLGMQTSFSSVVTARSAGMTPVHRYWFGLPLKTELSFAPGLAPTGAIVSCAQDMARYLTVMLQPGEGGVGTVLAARSVHEMLTPASPPATSHLLGTDFSFRYGEGWFAGPFGAVQDTRWHLGNLASFAAWMVLIPGTRQGVVVLINANSELPFFGADTAFSRIPVGVVNLLAGHAPPQGASVAEAYFKLTAVLLLALAVLAATVWWLVRRAAAWPSIVLALCSGLLALWLVFSGMGWSTLFAFMPDVTAWLAVMLFIPWIAVLWRTRR